MYRFNKNKKNIIVIIVIIIISFVTYYIYAKNDDSEIINFEDENYKAKEEKLEEKVEEKIIIVHIAGSVKKPGIVKLKENSRISDAIEQAGGLTENANISDINLAHILEDGMKIYISSNTEIKEENMEQSSVIETNDKNNQKLNINTSSEEELETLPGIGASTATKIIQYRKENGNFKNIEDIQNVKGIGKSKYEKIKDLISI